MQTDLIIANAAELLTLCGTDLGMIRQGWMAIKAGRIVAVGNQETIQSAMGKQGMQDARYIDASGKTVLPGFVDCHSHLVFGGDRLEEYLFNSGQTDRPARHLLGMACSMQRTRTCDAETLYRQSELRLQQMIANGTTTLECKSGYGLSTETELLQLKTVRALAERYPIDLISTFLGAHGWPDESSKTRYLDRLTEEMIPLVAEQRLATFCDIWVDEGFFTADDAKRVLVAGLHYGLRPKIHAEAYSWIGGSDVAAELRAASSDHLNYTPAAVMQKLGAAGVIGVLAPCTDYVVRHPKPANSRLMAENGLTVAVATNCNPGCWCTSMPFALQLAVQQNGMTPDAALRGATLNGALALELTDRGRLAAGYLADFQIWNTPRHEALFYHLGENVIDAVYKRGELIAHHKSPFLPQQPDDHKQEEQSP